MNTLITIAAMSAEQKDAFLAASGEATSGFRFLGMGALFALLFMYAAWTLVTAYKGWATGDVSGSALGMAAIRLMMLIILSTAFFLKY